MSELDDMGPSLSPSARALLDAARPDMAPDATAIRRMRAGVAAKVGGGLLAGSLATKIGLAAVIATAAVGSIVYATRGTPAPSSAAQPTSAPRTTRALAPAPDAALAAATPDPTPAALTLVTLQPPAPGARSSIDLSREVVLVDKAMAALAARDATHALSIIATYARETRGTGQLAEDAAAVEVEATCALDPSAAAHALAAFDARYPRSAQRARIAAACAQP